LATLSESERQHLTAEINKILNDVAERLRQGLPAELPDGWKTAVSMLEFQERGRTVRAIDRAIDRSRQQLPNLQVPLDLTELADKEFLLARIHRSVLFNRPFQAPVIGPFWPPSFDATEQSSAGHWEATEKAFTKHIEPVFEALRAYWEDRFKLFHAVTSDAPIADPKQRREARKTDRNAEERDTPSISQAATRLSVDERYEVAALSLLGLDWNMITKLYRLSDRQEEFERSANTITQAANRILEDAGLDRVKLFLEGK
jgi:hypothetical protein